MLLLVVVGRLENILKGFGRGIITAGFAASLFLGCPTENPVENHPPPASQNKAPVFTSSPITYVNETDYYRYDFNVTDPDGDKVSVSFVEKPSWLSIIGDSIYGSPPEVAQDQILMLK